MILTPYQGEFDKWKRTLTTDGQRQPSKRFLTDKLQGIHKLLNQNWTEGCDAAGCSLIPIAS